MNVIEEIIRSRRTALFVGVRNHSNYFGLPLFRTILSALANINYRNLPMIFVPVKNLHQANIKRGSDDDKNIIVKEGVSAFGNRFTLVFVNSDKYNEFAFILDDSEAIYIDRKDNNGKLKFIKECGCRQVVLCDTGVLKTKSFINLYNETAEILSCEDVSMILVAVIGCNRRASTDIELGDERTLYGKTSYQKLIKYDFNHIVTDRAFTETDISMILSSVNDAASIQLSKLRCETNEIDKVYSHDLFELIAGNVLETTQNPEKDFMELMSVFKLQNSIAFSVVNHSWQSDYKNSLRLIGQSSGAEKKRRSSEFIKKVKYDISTLINKKW